MKFSLSFFLSFSLFHQVILCARKQFTPVILPLQKEQCSKSNGSNWQLIPKPEDLFRIDHLHPSSILADASFNNIEDCLDSRQKTHEGHQQLQSGA
ncbi:hypothetical protein CEXT_259151 [Caerostris extrusa]|uniref:Secreted protein n=1 Tax=Caerostris extrusa TaxID=172846 RepID=A0AAV4Y9V9_CAEEX|nr:hypothetical protein CEXT_259151 [Caerostris extrusa]